MAVYHVAQKLTLFCLVHKSKNTYECIQGLMFLHVSYSSLILLILSDRNLVLPLLQFRCTYKGLIVSYQVWHHDNMACV